MQRALHSIACTKNGLQSWWNLQSWSDSVTRTGNSNKSLGRWLGIKVKCKWFDRMRNKIQQSISINNFCQSSDQIEFSWNGNRNLSPDYVCTTRITHAQPVHYAIVLRFVRQHLWAASAFKRIWIGGKPIVRFSTRLYVTQWRQPIITWLNWR